MLKFHGDGDNIAIEMIQDVEPILERNKDLQKQEQRSDWGRHVASIPNVILMRWLNEEYERGNVGIRLFNPEMDAVVERKLKDPEWRYLRTDCAHINGFLGFGS